MLPRHPNLTVTNIHASCVALGSDGILLLGPSGQGKSDLALRLVDDGAVLVADDRCDVWTDAAGSLWCAPPDALAGKLELRGIGIVDLAWAAPVRLTLAVRLSDQYERMPPAGRVEQVAGTSLPSVVLSAFEASAPNKVRRALDHLRRGA